MNSKVFAAWTLLMLVLPIIAIPSASAWSPGDEEAIFGHTFAEEYWTNNSIEVATQNGNASFTASYVHVDEFSAFLIAFNSRFANHMTSPP